MARKQRLSKPERERRREQRQKQQEAFLVQDTIARLSCSAETADDMRGQCDSRLEEIDVDLTFAGLALEIWQGRAGGEPLVPLVAELLAEQKRHAEVMGTLGRRFHALATVDHDDHVHLEREAIDSAYVRRRIFTPPEEQRPAVDRQDSTESDRR